MIRFNGKDTEGNRIVGLGISTGTFAKMMQGEIITVELIHLGIPQAKLLILAGPTEAAITRDLQSAIGERTNVHIDPSLIRAKPA